MQRIRPESTVHELITAFPFLIKRLAESYPKLAALNNPIARATLAKTVSLAKAAEMGGIPLDELVGKIVGIVREESGVELGVPGEVAGAGGQGGGVDAGKVADLKGIIEKLHRGVSLDEARREFEEVVGDAAPEEIAAMEQELINGGMPVEEIQRLCDVHVGVFQGSLDNQELKELQSGHPAHTYMAENREIERVANKFVESCRALESQGEVALPEALDALDELAKVEIHYTRKENQLFPVLEHHKFTGPSQVMWGLHDEIRRQIKGLQAQFEGGEIEGGAAAGIELARQITEMIYKEEKILLPTALSLISEAEWVRIRAGDDEIGYCYVEPGSEWQPEVEAAEAQGVGVEAAAVEGLLPLQTGVLTLEQLNGILTTMPVEFSFVDESDTVRYYSNHKERIFPRSPEVIGRKVHNCHPPQSVGTVIEILRAFKDGSRKEARFWLTIGGKFLVISYFPVFGGDGSYLGCLEVTQDATAVRALEGERRLLEWE